MKNDQSDEQNRNGIFEYSNEYYSECVDILHLQWDLGDEEASAHGNICAEIYMYKLLLRSDFMYVYLIDGHVVGIAGLRDRRRLHISLKDCAYFFKLAEKRASREIKNKKGLRHFEKCYGYFKQIKEDFDCELTIFITDGRCRGMGIGSAMFEFICSKAKTMGKRHMEIQTDTECNYNYYLKHNCRIVTESYLEEYGQRALVLAKEL